MLSTSPKACASSESAEHTTNPYHDRYIPYHNQPAIVEPKIPVFGPERVVLDPRIKKVHAKILRDMIYVGIVWTIIWTVIVCSVPGP